MNQMDKVFIIMNPNAGDEKGLEVSEQLEFIYQEQNVVTEIYQTKGEDNFKKVIQEAMDNGYQTIALLGGDGTISEVVNGIAELEKRPKIILLPAGTTNNFARTITNNQTREEILQSIQAKELEEIKVDVGQINNQYFISSIAIGAVPAVGWETDEKLKANFGSFAYFLEGMKSVIKDEQESFDIQIKMEDESKVEEDVFLFLVGLTNSIFGIPTFFSEATASDGKLHYFGLKKAGIFTEMSSVIKQIVKEENQEEESTFTGTFQNAVIHSNSSLNFLIDGEKGPKFPVTVDILPQHLTFIVPKNKK